MVIKSNCREKCPFCSVVNRFESPYTTPRGTLNELNFKADKSTYETLYLAKCTECEQVVLSLNSKMIFPLSSSRGTCPEEVPYNLKNDYEEACFVEPLSKKAAAALSRRCLQNLLHEEGFKDRDLNAEIDLAIKKLPSHLSSAIDAIRHVGNYAAHPLKFKNTGEIVEVEAGEAEWVLDVLEELFDFYYVQPKLTAVKRAALNVKLKELGKPELK
jgi:hypothetical protein